MSGLILFLAQFPCLPILQLQQNVPLTDSISALVVAGIGLARRLVLAPLVCAIAISQWLHSFTPPSRQHLPWDQHYLRGGSRHKA